MNNKTKKEITIEMIDKIKENMDNNYQHLEYIRDIICSDNVELNGERFCWNCGYFVAPSGCSNIFRGTTPFNWCEDWSKANEKDIEENKRIIDECCEINPLKKIKVYRSMLKEYKKDINELMDNIIDLIDLDYEKEEL